MEQRKEKPEAETWKERLRELEEWIDEYDHVFLIPKKTAEKDFRIPSLLKAAEKTGWRRNLFLSAAQLSMGKGYAYRRLTEEEEEWFLRLYHMYEFSDRFSVVSKTEVYGSLFNLADTGLLSMEEAAEALLH